MEVNADNDVRVQMVELIAESLEQTDYFDVTVETYEWNAYVGRVLDPEYASEPGANGGAHRGTDREARVRGRMTAAPRKRRGRW